MSKKFSSIFSPFGLRSLNAILKYSFIPSSIKKKIRFYQDMKSLKLLNNINASVDNLFFYNSVIKDNIFDSIAVKNLWVQSEKDVSQFKIPDFTGGVNVGDRRAIFYLISHFMPKNILEIGTHLGASTIQICSALMRNKSNESKVTTVDIRDVNCTDDKPWLKAKSSNSPKSILQSLSLDHCVDFVVDTSTNFLKNTDKIYDFIFLDGDHSATAVYQEVQLSLNKLSENGMILLHDYFPDMKPLWSNGNIIKGPYLAVKKLQSEGLNIEALPLGELPWPTKLGSKKTSLCLLLKK
jgi:predicted O-methyltransferase YrrM